MRPFQEIFRKTVAFTVLVLVGLSISIWAQLTPEMIVDLNSVRQVAISPDGKSIAYVLSVPRTADEAPGRSYSEIWLTDVKGASPVQYSSRPVSASSVSWSPDGKHLYFLTKQTDRNPHTQVYRMPVAGGAPALVTEYENTVSRYALSPDGKWLAFIAIPVKTAEKLAAEAAGQDWTIPDSDPINAGLWLQNLASGEVRRLTDNSHYVRNIYWSPDNNTIAFRSTATPAVDEDYVFSKISTVNVSSGDVQPLCKTEGKLGTMAYSPDGSQFAFLGAVDISDPIAQSLFVVPASGGTPKNFMEGAEKSGSALAWLDNGKIALLSNEGCVSSIDIVEVASGKMKSVYKGTPIVNSISVHAKSKSFAAVAHASAHPSEVFTGSLKNGKMTKLTDHNPQLANVRLAKEEVIEWQGADGWRIEGVLTYPLNYEAGKRYPLALQIHGGPEGVSQNGWSTRPTYPVQFLAANGYMVLQPNYRGSGGRGVAYSKGDHDDLGGKEFADVLAGVDALVDRGMVNNDQVCTGGWSYGGYFSAWAATRHSQRFKASMAAAGLTNWISFSGTTDIPHEMALVHWNSYWYQQRDLHWERSPLYHIQNAQTPTLVVHGMKDDRVHPEQSMQLYTALKHNNVDTKLLLYPREPHGLTERANMLHYMDMLINWYDKYVKDNGKDDTRAEQVIN